MATKHRKLVRLLSLQAEIWQSCDGLSRKETHALACLWSCAINGPSCPPLAVRGSLFKPGVNAGDGVTRAKEKSTIKIKGSVKELCVFVLQSLFGSGISNSIEGMTCVTLNMHSNYTRTETRPQIVQFVDITCIDCRINGLTKDLKNKGRICHVPNSQGWVEVSSKFEYELHSPDRSQHFSSDIGAIIEDTTGADNTLSYITIGWKDSNSKCARPITTATIAANLKTAQIIVINGLREVLIRARIR